MNSSRNMFSFRAGGGKLLSSRNGTIAIAAVTATVAGALALVSINNAREDSAAVAGTQGVLVATHFIPKGSPAEYVATTKAFRLEQVPGANLRADALTDAAALKGKVAVDDVYPGEQITTADFGA